MNEDENKWVVWYLTTKGDVYFLTHGVYGNGNRLLRYARRFDDALTAGEHARALREHPNNYRTVEVSSVGSVVPDIVSRTRPFLKDSHALAQRTAELDTAQRRIRELQRSLDFALKDRDTERAARTENQERVDTLEGVLQKERATAAEEIRRLKQERDAMQDRIRGRKGAGDGGWRFVIGHFNRSLNRYAFIKPGKHGLFSAAGLEGAVAFQTACEADAFRLARTLGKEFHIFAVPSRFNSGVVLEPKEAFRPKDKFVETYVLARVAPPPGLVSLQYYWGKGGVTPHKSHASRWATAKDAQDYRDKYAPGKGWRVRRVYL